MHRVRQSLSEGLAPGKRAIPFPGPPHSPQIHGTILMGPRPAVHLCHSSSVEPRAPLAPLNTLRPTNRFFSQNTIQPVARLRTFVWLASQQGNFQKGSRPSISAVTTRTLPVPSLVSPPCTLPSEELPRLVSASISRLSSCFTPMPCYDLSVRLSQLIPLLRAILSFTPPKPPTANPRLPPRHL